MALVGPGSAAQRFTLRRARGKKFRTTLRFLEGRAAFFDAFPGRSAARQWCAAEPGPMRSRCGPVASLRRAVDLVPRIEAEAGAGAGPVGVVALVEARDIVARSGHQRADAGERPHLA